MELSLQRVLMVAFFTSVGLGASIALVRKGGPQVLLFLVVATVGAALQNGLGVGLSQLFGLNPLLGIVSGSVALDGRSGDRAVVRQDVRGSRRQRRDNAWSFMRDVRHDGRRSSRRVYRREHHSVSRSALVRQSALRQSRRAGAGCR